MKRRDKKLEPRQIDFLKFYLDPKSETYSDALHSAIRAGYGKKYAEVITARNLDWLSDNISYTELVNKALRNLNEFLDEKKDKKVKADITKFTLERLHKKKFSSKTEVEHSGSIEEIQKADQGTKQLIDKSFLWMKKQMKQSKQSKKSNQENKTQE